jgi:hypothetical protein
MFLSRTLGLGPSSTTVTDEQKSYLRGKRYQQEKAKHEGAPEGNSNRKQRGNSYHVERTADKLASQLGVSEKTIRYDADFPAPKKKSQLFSARRQCRKCSTKTLGPDFLSGTIDEKSRETTIARLKCNSARFLHWRKTISITCAECW